MSWLIYKIGTLGYFSAIKIAALWNKRAQKWVSGRKNWKSKLKTQLPEKTKKRYWIHCASLGEFEQARALIEHLKGLKDCSIVISFFSPSGYEVRKNFEAADSVTYLPMDSPKNAKAFIDLVDPDVVYFIKYEFWASYIFELKERNIPLYGVSVILRPQQIYFKPYGSYFRKILQAFSHFYVQNQKTADLLAQIGVKDRVTRLGDTRYNRVVKIARSVDLNPKLEAFKQNAPVFILGSVWKEDMHILTPFITKNLPEEYKVIIAPHHIDEKNIAQLTTDLPQDQVVRYSQYDSRKTEQRYLVLDTMGELASAYRYGKIAYVGGGFKTGLHNTLEPASHGLPVLIGPHYSKFEEAKYLIKEGVAISVTQKKELVMGFQEISNTNPTKVTEAVQNKVCDLSKIKS